MKAAQWIDRVKAARGWESDYRVAKELGFKANTISTYRSSGGPMDEAIAIKVAHALGVDPAGVIIDQVAERSKDETVRAALREVADQRLYIMYSFIQGALSKAAEALPAILMPGVKSARTRHA